MKPSNIFFGLDGRAKIGDFGLATTSNSVTAVDELSSSILANQDHTFDQGTEVYMSPEQKQRQPYDHKVDIFALGLILLELLLTFGSKMERNVFFLNLTQPRFTYDALKRKGLSHVANEIVEKMVSIKPENRPEAQDILKIEEVAKSHQIELYVWPVVYKGSWGFGLNLDKLSKTGKSRLPCDWKIVPIPARKVKGVANRYEILEEKVPKFRITGSNVGGKVFLCNLHQYR